MSWMILFVVAVLLFLILSPRLGVISASDAVERLRRGALVVDVRTPEEYMAEHLPQAVSLPLDQFETLLPKRAPDKSQILLLHCQSGVRSRAAKRKALSLGYSNVFNLGSYSRAASIVAKR